MAASGWSREGVGATCLPPVDRAGEWAPVALIVAGPKRFRPPKSGIRRPNLGFLTIKAREHPHFLFFLFFAPTVGAWERGRVRMGEEMECRKRAGYAVERTRGVPWSRAVVRALV